MQELQEQDVWENDIHCPSLSTGGDAPCHPCAHVPHNVHQGGTYARLGILWALTGPLDCLNSCREQPCDGRISATWVRLQLRVRL